MGSGRGHPCCLSKAELGARSVDKKTGWQAYPAVRAWQGTGPRLPAAPTRMDGPGQLLVEKARSMAYSQVP